MYIKIARSELGSKAVVQTYKKFVQYLFNAFRYGYWREKRKISNSTDIKLVSTIST